MPHKHQGLLEVAALVPLTAQQQAVAAGPELAASLTPCRVRKYVLGWRHVRLCVSA
jgi:hypothetical protein